MDTDFGQSMDDMRIPYNQVNSSRKGFMNGTNTELLHFLRQ